MPEPSKQTLGFFHDAPLVKDRSDNLIYSVGFSYDVWRRYLVVFRELIVVTRLRIGETSNLQLSSGPRVEFAPVASYNMSLHRFLRRRAIRRFVRTQLLRCDAAVIRLPSVIGYIACHEARRMGVPYALELVGCAWDAYWFHSFFGKLLAPFEFLGMRRRVRLAPQVLYVTDEFLQRRYPTRGRQIACSDVALHIRPASAGTECPNHRKDLIAEGLSPIELGRIAFGTIGAVDLAYKGHADAIRALKIVRDLGYDLEYQVVGGGSPSRLQAIACELGVSDYVRFLGTLSHDEVGRFLCGLDFYVQPSLAEAQSRALLEAMAAGLPVIGSTAGGIPDNVLPRFVFKRGNPRDLSLKIVDLIEGGYSEAVEHSRNRALSFDVDVLERMRIRFLTDLALGLRTGR